MSDVRVYPAHDLPAAPAAARANAILRRAARDVVVEVVDAVSFAEMRWAWVDLTTRADATNAFMDPAVLAAAAEVAPNTPQRTVLVWKSIGGRRQLAGAWSFAVGRAAKSILPTNVLRAPTYDQCYLSTPVIDRNHLDETIEAMLDAIADDAELPKIVTLDMMASEGPTYDALMRALGRRGSPPCEFSRSQRPKLESGTDGKTYLERSMSSSTRKKLRQHRRKLAEKGTLNTVIATQPGAVCRALEEFLRMEAAGWKGRNGTALLNSKADAGFMRGAVGALAAAGCVSIHTLYVGSKPVSMQIIARAGSIAFTWKTTYDETFHDFSPGTLLFEDYTAALLADDSIAAVDSCAYDDQNYMAAWTGRQAVADIWFDARQGGSLAFQMLSTAQMGYRSLRNVAKQRYLAWRDLRKARAK